MEVLPSVLYKTLEKIMELTSTGIIIIDGNKSIVFVNDYFAHNICKADKSTLINNNLGAITEIPHEVKNIIDFDTQSILTEHNVVQFSTDITLFNQIKVTFRIIKIGIVENNSQFIITFFINISDQVEIFKTLKYSERKYRYLLNSVPVGLMLVEASTLKIREFNQNLLAILNAGNSSDLTGKNLCDVIKLDNAKIYEDLTGRWGKSLSYGCKVTYRNEDKYLQFNYTPIMLEDDRCYIVTIVDITALQKAQDELALSHNQIKYLISAIDSILIGVSNNDIITHWNRTAEKVFGISQDEAVGKHIIGFNIPWEWDKIYMGITNSIAERHPVTLPDVGYESIYGQRRLLGITVNPIIDDNGNLFGYLLFGRDITDKRINEAEILQAQKLQSIGQLAAGIAHEINTPAQYVNDNLYYIQETVKDLEHFMALCDKCITLLQNAKQLPPKLKLIVEEIVTLKKSIDYDYCTSELPNAVTQSLEGMNKIVQIVKSLKSFAHPDTQTKVAINIHTLIDDVITISRNEWKYVADLSKDFKNVDIIIPCFPNQLSQVFLNMIINARDAIQEAIDKKIIERGHIEISTDMDTDYAIVTIKDNGIGIQDNIKSKIFDPFFTTKEVGKGTGQGLAIAHSIIYDTHKGKIRVNSEYGRGTIFYVYLPLREKLLET